jgi:hypothetical protein
LSSVKSSTTSSSGFRDSIIQAAKEMRLSVGVFFMRGVEVDLMYMEVSSMSITAQTGTYTGWFNPHGYVSGIP